MTLIMMGTGDFAVPTFRQLLQRGYAVRLLVTQPDRPQGRHQELVPAAIKRLAAQRNIEVFQPESVNAPDSIERLAALEPDLLIVAAYGQILCDDLLRVSRLGGINLHASLLPKYRGAAPVNWAIYHGETVTGVTVIQMTPRVDAGAILLQSETAIGPTETAGELEARLAELGAPVVCQAIEGLAAGTLPGRAQDRSRATLAPKLKKEHALIDWARSAIAVCNQIRAMQPWPMAYTFLHRVNGTLAERMIVEQALPMHDPSRPAGPGAPGALSTNEDSASGVGRLVVACGGNDAAEIKRLRPAGKRSMSASQFLHGNRIEPGDRFGPEVMS